MMQGYWGGDKMDRNRNGIPYALETVLSISGIMAIVSLVIAGVMLILGEADVPAWLVAIIGGASGSAVSQHGQRSATRQIVNHQK